jgi:hypothetical protein
MPWLDTGKPGYESRKANDLDGYDECFVRDC